MKSLFKKTITAAFYFLCFTLAAQDEQTYSTVKDAFIVLTAIVQKPDGKTSKVRITNKDILTALNATNAFNFDNHAKLLMRSDDSGLPYFIARESTRNVGTNSDIDVSEFLTVTEPDDAVHSGNQLLNWGIWNITLDTGSGTDFTFWGLTTLHTGRIPTGQGGILFRTVSLTSIGSGPGHVDGAAAQFSGRVTANHGRID